MSVSKEKVNQEKKSPESTGNIKIPEEVIAIVSGIAASEVNGVAGMSSSFASGIAELLGKKRIRLLFIVHR